MIENVNQQGNQRQENMDLIGFYYNNAKIDYDQLKERVSVLEEDNKILNTTVTNLKIQITSLENQKEEQETKILNLTTSLANQNKEHETALANQKKEHELALAKQDLVIQELVGQVKQMGKEMDSLKNSFDSNSFDSGIVDLLIKQELNRIDFKNRKSEYENERSKFEQDRSNYQQEILLKLTQRKERNKKRVLPNNTETQNQEKKSKTDEPSNDSSSPSVSCEDNN